MKKLLLSSGLFCIATLLACESPAQQKSKNMSDAIPKTTVTVPTGQAVATFGTGCFWCTEAVFLRLEGVEKVKSGYAGGQVVDPTYEEVCGKKTGHAEVVQIFFKPEKISYADLLSVFFQVHDPTTLNRQGNDIGPQYRSAIFYHSDEQKQQAEYWKQQVTDEKIYPNTIVTEITPFSNFYPAENYHDNYFALNPQQGYCQFVVRPKVEKFEKLFKNKLKKKS